MEKIIIKIAVESDNEQDLKDAVDVVTQSLQDQPWRSEKTKSGKATSKPVKKCAKCSRFFE